MPILIIAVMVLGLAVGSFLNVVIYRVPRELSLVRPPSACTSCRQPIRNRHNVPVLGWLVLRGRCADCRTRISPRYPLIELATGIAFTAVTLKIADIHLLAALPAFLTFTAAGIALTMIDLDVKRLPNAIVLPLYPILLVALAAGAFLEDNSACLLRAIVGGAALYGLYYLLAFCYPAGMGFGDVKLAGLVGMVLSFISYPALIVGSFAAFLLGGILGIALIARSREARKRSIPFGPFMVLGALVAIFVSEPLWHAYTNFLLT